MIYLKYVYLLYTHVASIGIQEINCFQSLILNMQTMNNYYTIFIRKIKINFKNFDFNIKINLRIINIPQMFFFFSIFLLFILLFFFKNNPTFSLSLFLFYRKIYNIYLKIFTMYNNISNYIHITIQYFDFNSPQKFHFHTKIIFLF